MKKKRMSREEIFRLAEEAGIPSAPPDHPIYSEGPSITFISRKEKRPDRKDTCSTSSESLNDSDT